MLELRQGPIGAEDASVEPSSNGDAALLLLRPSCSSVGTQLAVVPSDIAQGVIDWYSLVGQTLWGLRSPAQAHSR